MDDTRTGKTITLAADEKATQVMIYTRQALIRGEAISKENVRVSTWLRTVGAPEYVPMRNVHVILFNAAGQAQPLAFSAAWAPAVEIVAFHIVPPAKDPPDYDLTEPNRKMEPVTALLGQFRFNGHVRMTAQTDFNRFLEVTHTNFLSLYDVAVSNPALPSMGVRNVPMLVLRPGQVIFSQK